MRPFIQPFMQPYIPVRFLGSCFVHMTHKAVRVPSAYVAPPATFPTYDSVWVGRKAVGPVVADRLEGEAASLPLAVKLVGPIQPMRVASKTLELAGAVAPLLLVAQPEGPAEPAKAV
jgi:hypothetical protein